MIKEYEGIRSSILLGGVSNEVLGVSSYSVPPVRPLLRKHRGRRETKEEKNGLGLRRFVGREGEERRRRTKEVKWERPGVLGTYRLWGPYRTSIPVGTPISM